MFLIHFGRFIFSLLRLHIHATHDADAAADADAEPREVELAAIGGWEWCRGFEDRYSMSVCSTQLHRTAPHRTIQVRVTELMFLFLTSSFSYVCIITANT